MNILFTVTAFVTIVICSEAIYLKIQLLNYFSGRRIIVLYFFKLLNKIKF